MPTFDKMSFLDETRSNRGADIPTEHQPVVKMWLTALDEMATAAQKLAFLRNEIPGAEAELQHKTGRVSAFADQVADVGISMIPNDDPPEGATASANAASIMPSPIRQLDRAEAAELQEHGTVNGERVNVVDGEGEPGAVPSDSSEAEASA